MAIAGMLSVSEIGARWRLVGTRAGRFAVVDEFLGYLVDRNYSPRTVRAYAFDLLAFVRWLDGEGIDVPGRGHRCAAAVPDVLPYGDTSGPAGWQRVLDP